MPDNTPDFDVKVIGADDYALMITLGIDGNADITGRLSNPDIAKVLTHLTASFHAKQNLPLEIVPELAELLTAAGWTPPARPADSFTLSDYDFLELAAFDAKADMEGFEYAWENYAPTFEDPDLEAWAGSYDRLNALHTLHGAALAEFWETDDAHERHNAHLTEAAQRRYDAA